MTAALVAVPLIPLASALAILFLGRAGERWGGWLSVSAVTLSLVALTLASRAPMHAEVVWMRAGALTLTVGLRLDALSRFVAFIVCLVALAVGVYAVGYMHAEHGRRRFFAAVSFFAGAMLALVLADSMLVLFASWELVGVASWLLIGHKRDEPPSVRAAAEAFLVTRVADLAFFLGWLLLLLAAHTTDISAVVAFSRQPAHHTVCLAAAALMLIGVAGKSAQVPFSAWLPDAMTAPTPVSALLHSATMVAAGVYLLLRLYPVFAASAVMLDIVLWSGTVSAIVGAFVASWERDLKRLLAWSTIAQLGEMMMAVGFRAPAAALFHFTAHAAFKATLFLCAGVIERQTGTRRLDDLGGLRRSMPWTSGAFGAASLALAAVPPFAGYFSEDAILGAASNHGFVWALLLVSLVFLSGVYIARAGMSVFGGSGSSRHGASDPPPVWLAPMLVLATASIALGLVLRGSIGPLVPLGPETVAAHGWSFVAVLASLAGLTLGSVQVSRFGPAAAFGVWPAALNQLSADLAVGVAGITRAIARRIDPVEQQVDRLARSAAFMFTSIAGVADAAELSLDRAARITAHANLLAADAAESVESGGFAAAADRVARAMHAVGGEIRRVQAGPVYVYTFVLVASALVAGVAAILMNLRW